MSSEQEFEFTLLLDGSEDHIDDISVALYNTFDDASLSVRSGRMYLEFARKGKTKVHAILSAIRDVDKSGAGVSVLRIDACDLVNQADIHRLSGLTRQCIANYIAGIRGPGGFPGPACNITEGAPLWRWCDVAEWLYEHGYVGESVLRDAAGLATINAALELKHQRQKSPEVMELVDNTLCCP